MSGTRQLCSSRSRAYNFGRKTCGTTMANDRFSLAGKTALVTGASSGFGWHFAR